jgi:hypothetical protein
MLPDNIYEQLRKANLQPGQRALSYYKMERLFWHREQRKVASVPPSRFIVMLRNLRVVFKNCYLYQISDKTIKSQRKQLSLASIEE